jgi:hypothetical protein
MTLRNLKTPAPPHDLGRTFGNDRMICICRPKTCIGIGPTVLFGQGIGAVDRSARSEHPGTTTILAQRDLIVTLSNQVNLQQTHNASMPSVHTDADRTCYSFDILLNSKSISAKKVVIPGGKRVSVLKIRGAEYGEQK